MNALLTLADRVLYEDNHLIIINKLPSEIVQGDKTGDKPLSDLVRDYIGEKYSKPGKVFLGVTHRIDRPVSGAVIFARTSKALGRLNSMLKAGDIEKRYRAVVQRKPEKERGHLVHYLIKNEQQNKSYVCTEDTAGAKRAELRYSVLAGSDRYYLLEIELLTGRHHQIRCQLSHIGCPIKGDLKYGYDRPNKNGSIHLHAYSLSFIHPVSKKQLNVTAPPPSDDPLWQYFHTV
ncbi:MAG: RNA pseudouridine synthase [Bacteroidales bacterium]|nr:RNA pseudouridine synthase [Bacteroidales bacterium]